MDMAEKEMFAVKLSNPSKTMEQCCMFIIGEVKKNGCCGFTGDEILGWAMLFGDEPEIEVSEISSCKVVVNHTVELSEEERVKACQDAITPVTRKWLKCADLRPPRQ